MKELICKKLKELEVTEDISILYAIESGSRIWGFESSDSDWDVRFIYVRKPEWYLTIGCLYNWPGNKDTIEIGTDENEIDMAGWDLSKALHLLTKTNCPLMEWLDSDIYYVLNKEFLSDIRKVSNLFYSRTRSMYHYYHMTKGNVISYMGDRDLVWAKKYLYIIRTLLCCVWIEKSTSPAPVKLRTMLDQLNVLGVIPDDIAAEILSFIKRKMNGEELGKQPPNKLLSDYINSEMLRLSSLLSGFEPEVLTTQENIKELNNLFRKYVMI